MQRFFIFSAVCFIALCAGIYISLPHAELAIGTFSDLNTHEAKTEQEPVKNRMRFVGDVMLARNVEFLIDTYGISYVTSLLPEHPKGAYLVGNFEGSIPVTHVPTKSMTFSFSVRPEHVQSLSEYGFTHLGLSNNHAYDFGFDDFVHTQNVLSGSSLSTFGDPGELATSSVTTVRMGSTTVALIGIYAVESTPLLHDVVSVFKNASFTSDIQIAYVHWGEEYKLLHNSTQETLSHALVDAGADLVVGHHPHVIQDVELYKNVPIFYSLGNFIFDQYFSDAVQNGLMLELAYEDNMQISLYPVTSIGSRSAPRFASAFEKEEMLNELAENSSEELRDMIKEGIIQLDI